MTCPRCGSELSVVDNTCIRCSGTAPIETPSMGTPSIAPTGSWKVGDRVLAHWALESYWYPATITEISNTAYYVVFDDGDEQWTEPAGVTAENLNVGSRIFANWKHQGKYYPGSIETRQGNVISIAYDDGDRETTTISSVRVPR